MTGHVVLLALAYAAWWLASRYWWPFRACPRCSGKGTNKGSNRRRFGDCGRCHGSRKVQRIGSRTVHKLARSLAAAWRDREGKS